MPCFFAEKRDGFFGKLTSGKWAKIGKCRIREKSCVELTILLDSLLYVWFWRLCIGISDRNVFPSGEKGVCPDENVEIVFPSGERVVWPEGS